MAMISADNRGLRLATRYAVLGLIALIFVFPLVFMLMSSLKPDQQLLQDSGNLRAFLPVGDISLSNYTDVFSRVPFARFLANSLGTALVTVLLGLFVLASGITVLQVAANPLIANMGSAATASPINANEVA